MKPVDSARAAAKPAMPNRLTAATKARDIWQNVQANGLAAVQAEMRPATAPARVATVGALATTEPEDLTPKGPAPEDQIKAARDSERGERAECHQHRATRQRPGQLIGPDGVAIPPG